MLRGYIRKHKRVTETAQREALEALGVKDAVTYLDGRGAEDLDAAIKALRKGDGLAVLHLWLIAPPRKSGRDKPRRGMVEAMQKIEAKGAYVLEAATGRASNTDARDDMILDAIDWLSGKSKGIKSAENGKAGGRPPKQFDASTLEAAERVWFDLRYRTWREAAAALPQGFSARRAYNTFGPRHQE